MLVVAILLNLFFALLSFCSLIIGGYIYLKSGTVPPVHEALSYIGWNINQLYSPTFVGYNEIMQSFLETNFIYGSFELLLISFGITWIFDFSD